MALTCLALSAVANNFASAPDSVPLRATTGVTLHALIAMNDWTPGVAFQSVLGKWNVAPNLAYVLSVNADGTLRFNYSTTGTNTPGGNSTIPISINDGDKLHILASYRASDARIQFFTAPGSIANPVASDFTQLGTNVTGFNVANIFAGTSVLSIGALGSGASPISGKVYRARVYDGVFSVAGFGGTLVFDADFTSITKTSGRTPTSFTESSANAATVTLNGTQWDWFDGWSAILVTSLADNVDRTSYSTASWIPAPNRLIKVDVGTSVASGSAVAPTLSGNGITWEKVAETTSATSTNIHTFVGKSGASPSAGALTADFAGVTQDSCSIHITEIDGADLSGTASAAVLQSNPAAVSGQASPYSRVLASVPTSTSRCFSAWQINLNSALTPRTNWTELSDAGFTTPTRRLETQWRADAAEQTADVSGWASTTAVRVSVIEIKTAPSGVSIGLNAGVSTKSGTTFSAGAVL